MSDADDMAPFDELEGAYVTLKMVGDAGRLAQHFKEFEDMRFLIGAVDQAPDQAWLTDLMDDEFFFAWSIADNGKQIGYAFFVLFDGPPYVAFFYFDPSTDEVRIGKDCLEQMVPVFFKNTEEEALYYYQPKPVNEEIHAELIDSGFDVWEDNPTIDPETETCYVLERYTFDAYYGDGEEEFEEGEDYDF